MKKFTFQVNTLINSILAGAIGLLGFTACDDENVNGGGSGFADMYGTPIGTYEIKGAVTDESGKAVSGAEIILRQLFDREHIHTAYGDTVATDKDGRYSIKSQGMIQRLRIVCLPPDRSLEADSTEVVVKFDGKGEDIWDKGTAKATVDFTLKAAK